MTDVQTPWRVLLVDDDVDFCRDLAAQLGAHVLLESCHTREGAIERLKAGSPAPDLVLLDLDLGHRSDGLDILRATRPDLGGPPVIMVSGTGHMDDIVRAIKLGAYHYVPKPPNVEALLNLMDKALGHREARHALRVQESEIDRIRGQFLAADPRQLALLQEIRRAAPTDATVLITGESGTGKELVAALLHRQSRRAQGPFHPFNCAAVNPELLRSELFGHVRGAFTGAVDDRAGAIETARGGTLFLDEIGASSCELQHGLLRLLEQRQYQRVGDDTIRTADVRLLAATSSDLEREMAEGRFAEALFHRLNVVRIHIPPLRDRRGDILPLAQYFLARICAQMGRPEATLSAAAAGALREHPWPGNVRELRNLIERAIIACRDGEIGLGDLFAVTSPDTVGSYHEARERSSQLFQRRYLATQLRAADGNISLAAARSGLLRQAFARMLKKVGLDPRDFGGHSNQDVAP